MITTSGLKLDGHMISFLSGCPSLCRKSRALTMFRLSCSSLQHIVLDWLDVKFGSPNGVGNGPDLSEKFKPVQSFSSCSNPESEIFTDASSVTVCWETLENIAETAVEPGCSLWSFVDLSDEQSVLKKLVASYTKFRATRANIEKFLDFSAPDTMCI